MQRILTQLLLLCVGGLLGMMLTRSCQQPEQIVTEIVKTDTLTITRVDTITIVKPQPYKVEVRDTIYINDNINGNINDNINGNINDNINGNINDNINGNIFIQEIKEYQDSTYYARISGINAYLEEIRVYPRTEYKYITTTEKVYEKPRKWSIGIQGGVGITPKGLQPYLGVGVTRRLEF